jgi:DivIVA domain-containing protein
MAMTFIVVLRGYKRADVDEFVAKVERGERPPAPTFRVSLRGYDRVEVDQYVQQHLTR